MNFDKIVAQPEADLANIEVFRVENFPVSPVVPWLDRPDSLEHVDALLRKGSLTPQEAVYCRKWAQDGYIVIPGMFSAAQLDGAWADYETAIANGAVSAQPDYGVHADNKSPGRVLNPHFKIEAFRQLLDSPHSQNIVSLLLGAAALPFQTIAGHIGSQQKAHSDSIHMTTYPQGYLVANWIAFEDIADDSGPLEFYPGSHKLPYIYTKDCGIGVEEGRSGYGAYQAKYEPAVQKRLQEASLQPEYFRARKGDVLFWHANLLHGGSTIRNLRSTRKALVCHYFAQGCVCYHDYTGTVTHLTKLPKKPMLLQSQFDAATYLARNPDVAAAGVDAYQHYVRHGYKEGRQTQ
jgi:Phytanoyl-CoA dioxygenase (PhyH)